MVIRLQDGLWGEDWFLKFRDVGLHLSGVPGTRFLQALLKMSKDVSMERFFDSLPPELFTSTTFLCLRHVIQSQQDPTAEVEDNEEMARRLTKLISGFSVCYYPYRYYS